MQTFTRKNVLVCSGTFTAINGGGTPTNAEMIIAFTNLAGAAVTETINLVLSGSAWSGAWDSSEAAGGRIDWMAHCWGGLVAAQQGNFELCANPANKT
jgi:hypothetical protein